MSHCTYPNIWQNSHYLSTLRGNGFLWLILLVIGMIVLIKLLQRPRQTFPKQHQASTDLEPESAEEILAKKFVEGSLTEEEFIRKKKLIQK
ncbi:hypothetical protein ACWN8V_01560 [Vagococcus elongatus]|uniref:SHOCT domain-containing protein n=1 Tax=Vagococcus elongatus TaxID=180344 RepID=A0A430B4N2_9ENTE|nr:hypothetical protein [Vagococcus elongatus]RSU15263.1 hypothetical protein CBF29_02715 [Vagococcus elongatus]